MSATLSARFDGVSWRLDCELIDRSAEDDVRSIAADRVARLQSGFAAWAGIAVEDLDDPAVHASHQVLMVDDHYRTGIAKDHRHYLRGELELDTLLDLRFSRLPTNPKVAATLGELLGTDTWVVHLPPMVRFKVPDVRPRTALLPRLCWYVTGLYIFRGVREGIAAAPDVTDAVRAELDAAA